MESVTTDKPDASCAFDDEPPAIAQKKQKETYDRKHQPPVLELESKVLLENTAQKQQKGGKMDPLWLGSYIINKDLGEVESYMCKVTIYSLHNLIIEVQFFSV